MGDPLLNLGQFVARPPDRIQGAFVGLLGVIGVIVGLTIFVLGHVPADWGVILLLVCTATPMILAEVLANRVHRRPSAGLDAPSGSIEWTRCLRKWIGLVVTLLALGLGYWVLPEYHKPDYARVWEIMGWLIAATLLLSIPYILWTDARMREPEDIYARIGGMFARMECDGAELRRHCLTWAIKGFFLPLMLSFLFKNLDRWQKAGLDFSTFADFYTSSLAFIFVLDVSFGCVGYLLTLRILDAHVRHPEETAAGWIAALVCYPPLLTAFGGSYFRFNAERTWPQVLGNYPVLMISWGFVIILLYVIYVWATISFGCRFSNLTNRGVIAHGAYRYSKHPAYLSKCAAWWLELAPFFAFADPLLALRACLLMAVKSLVYWVRARTEERLMKQDPAYALYSDWINTHGLLAQLKLRLRAPLAPVSVQS